MRRPDSWQTAQATVAIAVITSLAYVVVSLFALDDWAILAGGFTPADVTGTAEPIAAPWFVTPLTSTLIHISLLHLGLNMLILLFCGRSVEGALGPVALVLLYLLGAYAAAAGQYVVDPRSDVPMIGASGAISAVIGAYAMLFGRNRVRVTSYRLAVWLNALWLLAAWVVLQVATGIVAGQWEGLLLAVGAHIGGFVLGLVLARPLLLWKYRHA